MPLVDFMESRFGPDLVDCAKEGKEYYQRLFDSTGVSANKVVVVDDDPNALGWAMELGAKAVQAKLSTVRKHPEKEGVIAVMTDLRQLPTILNQIFG